MASSPTAVITVHIPTPTPTYKKACQLRLERLCWRYFKVPTTNVIFVPPSTNGRPKEADLSLTNTSKVYWGGNLFKARTLIRAEARWLHTDKDCAGRKAFIIQYPGEDMPNVEHIIEEKFRSFFGLHDTVVAFQPGSEQLFLETESWEYMHDDERDLVTECMTLLERRTTDIQWVP